MADKKVDVNKDLKSVWSQASFAEPHSQYTTVLLDGSIEKGISQPHNHVIVEEYLGPDDEGLSLVKLRKTQDRMLLAVVGILDAVRTQRNVSYWIRSGGLHFMDLIGCGMAREVWFRNPEFVECWKTRGIQVLGELGIDVLARSKRSS